MAAKEDGQHNRFSMFTHRMKESLGLAEKTESNDIIKDVYKRIDVLHEQLKTLVKGVSRVTSSSRDLSDSGLELSSALTDCHVSYAEDQERVFLSGCAGRAAEFERVMEDIRSKTASQIDSEVVGTMKSVMDNEIKEAKNQKALYESTRVDLSNAQTKLAAAIKSKQQPKIDAAKVELDAIKKKYEQVEKETNLKLHDASAVTEYKMLDSLIQYVEIQKSFFNRGYQMLNASMADIADYRSYAESTRKTITSRPTKRATIRMSVAMPKSSKRKLFGLSLEELEKEGRSVEGVPVFFISTIVYIEQFGLDEEGLFRIAGNQNITEAIRAQLEASGGEYDWGNTGEKLLNASDCLKQFLREMPEPLLSQDLCARILAFKPSENPDDHIAKLQALLTSLPGPHKKVLKLLFTLLHKVTVAVKSTRMSPVALATCMGPNLTAMNFGPDVDPFEQTAQLNSIVAFMIQHCPKIFAGIALPTSAPASPRQETVNPGLLDLEPQPSSSVTALGLPPAPRPKRDTISLSEQDIDQEDEDEPPVV